MDAKVIWQQGLHFFGTAPSGFEVPLAQRKRSAGLTMAFRPLELMAVSLAGCPPWIDFHPEKKPAGGNPL